MLAAKKIKKEKVNQTKTENTNTFSQMATQNLQWIRYLFYKELLFGQLCAADAVLSEMNFF